MGESPTELDSPASTHPALTLDAAMDIDGPSLRVTENIPPSVAFDTSSPPTNPGSTPEAHLVTPGTPSSQETTTASPLYTPVIKVRPRLVPSEPGDIIGRTIHDHLDTSPGISEAVIGEETQAPSTPKPCGRKRRRSVLVPFSPAHMNNADDEDTPPRSTWRSNLGDVPKSPRSVSSTRFARTRRQFGLPDTSPSQPSSPHQELAPPNRPYIKPRKRIMPDCGYRPPRNKLDVSQTERQVTIKEGERIRAGETIMRAPLTCPTLNTSALTTHCAGCLLDPLTKFRLGKGRYLKLRTVQDGYLECTRCHKVQFCSLKCCAQYQMTHWPECRALSRCEQVPSVEVRLLAKMIFARATIKTPKLEVYTLPDMIEKSTSEELSRVVEKVIMFLSKVHRSDGTFRWSEYNFSSSEDAASFIRQARAKIMLLTDDEDRSLGWCIADLPSRIRHSCRPNAYVAFPEGLAVMNPLRVISLAERQATEGKEEEITISYVDPAVPRHQRDALLMKQGFQHDCDECKTQHGRVEDRWAMLHQGCKGEYEDGLLSLNGLALQILVHRVWPKRTVPRTESYAKASQTRSCTMGQCMIIPSCRKADCSTTVSSSSDCREKCLYLRAILSASEEHFPGTIYPLAHLRRRQASLLLLSPFKKAADCEIAVAQLEKSYWAYLQAHDRIPRPVTSARLDFNLRAHVELLRHAEEDVDIARKSYEKRKWTYDDKEGTDDVETGAYSRKRLLVRQAKAILKMQVINASIVALRTTGVVHCIKRRGWYERTDCGGD